MASKPDPSSLHFSPGVEVTGRTIGWHNFRHTFSTMLRALGADVNVQQELLRHADVRTTLNLYTQAVTAQKREAIAKVARLVLPKRTDSGPISARRA